MTHQSHIKVNDWLRPHLETGGTVIVNVMEWSNGARHYDSYKHVGHARHAGQKIAKNYCCRYLYRIRIRLTPKTELDRLLAELDRVSPLSREEQEEFDRLMAELEIPK